MLISFPLLLLIVSERTDPMFGAYHSVTLLSVLTKAIADEDVEVSLKHLKLPAAVVFSSIASIFLFVILTDIFIDIGPVKIGRASCRERV